jgi:hypothetical protein
MDKPASESSEADPESLRALADDIVNRQRNIQNYILNTAIDFWLVRRLGLEPLTVPGRLVAWTFHFLTVLVPAVALSAITGDGSGAALASWIIVAAVWGGIWTMAPLLYERAIPNHLSWLSAIAEEKDLRRVMMWCDRWYKLRVVVPVAVALTLGTVILFCLLAVRGSAVPVPAGSLYAGAYLVFMLMQTAYALCMMTGEAYNMTTCSYELYRLSPADSVVVRRSLQGYNQLAALNVLAATVGALSVVFLLPAGSGLIWPVLLFLLLVLYLSTAAGSIVPRVVLGRIIYHAKEAEMEVLQAQLDELVPRVRELSEEEYGEMTRLQKTHDTIRDSPENLLPLGAILRTVGALFLSTAAILITAFAQEWIAEWAKRLAP